MNQHISALESRTLFSVSSVTTEQLQVDKQAITNDAVALGSTLTLFFSQNSAFTSQIKTDFRTLPKSDQYLLSQLVKGELKSKAVFSADTALLNARTRSLAAATVNAGAALIAHPSTHAINVLGSDIIKLAASYVAPLAKLNDQVSNTTVDAVRAAITGVLANDTQLISDIQAEQTEVNENRAAIVTAAEKLVTDIGVLGTDLATVKTDVGTYPSLVGEFTGNLSVEAGKLKGQTIPVVIDILSENTTTGKFTGSLTGVDPSGSNPLTGSVTLAGNTTLRAITSSQGALTLSGSFASPNFTGKFSDKAGRGLFVLTD